MKCLAGLLLTLSLCLPLFAIAAQAPTTAITPHVSAVALQSDKGQQCREERGSLGLAFLL